MDDQRRGSGACRSLPPWNVLTHPGPDCTRPQISRPPPPLSLAVVRMFDDGELAAEIVPEIWVLGGYVSRLSGPTTTRTPGRGRRD